MRSAPNHAGWHLLPEVLGEARASLERRVQDGGGRRGTGRVRPGQGGPRPAAQGFPQVAGAHAADGDARQAGQARRFGLDRLAGHAGLLPADRSRGPDPHQSQGPRARRRRRAGCCLRARARRAEPAAEGAHRSGDGPTGGRRRAAHGCPLSRDPPGASPRPDRALGPIGPDHGRDLAGDRHRRRQLARRPARHAHRAGLPDRQRPGDARRNDESAAATSSTSRRRCWRASACHSRATCRASRWRRCSAPNLRRDVLDAQHPAGGRRHPRAAMGADHQGSPGGHLRRPRRARRWQPGAGQADRRRRLSHVRLARCRARGGAGPTPR